ncbi:MAG: hypothetical protein ACHQRM_15990 [Bacteroidia bacterium]
MKTTTTLNYWEGYLSVFTFLQLVYVGKKEKEDLDNLIDSMNPQKRRMDRTMLIDWICVLSGNEMLKDKIELEECFPIMVKYLSLEEKKYGLHYKHVIKKLKRAYSKRKHSMIWNAWVGACLMTKA